MNPRRGEAVAALEALGATFSESGDVKALRRAINQDVAEANRNPKVFHKSSQCTGKRRYPSHAAAMRDIKKANHLAVKAYRCVYCGGWHNGRAPGGSR